jgi:hypothetical protein
MNNWLSFQRQKGGGGGGGMGWHWVASELPPALFDIQALTFSVGVLAYLKYSRPNCMGNPHSWTSMLPYYSRRLGLY